MATLAGLLELCLFSEASRKHLKELVVCMSFERLMCNEHFGKLPCMDSHEFTITIIGSVDFLRTLL